LSVGRESRWSLGRPCGNDPDFTKRGARGVVQPCSRNEGDPWWQNQERPDRLLQDRLPVARRHLPYAYVYPRAQRATRDLLRRRTFLVRKRAELLTHIQNTNTQYNLPTFEQRIDKTKDRGAIVEHFDQSSVQMSVAADVALLESYDEVIRDLELYTSSMKSGRTTGTNSRSCAPSPESVRSWR